MGYTAKTEEFTTRIIQEPDIPSVFQRGLFPPHWIP